MRSSQLLYCASTLLVCTRHGLVALSCLQPCASVAWLPIALPLSCACEKHAKCHQCVLIAHLGAGAAGCPAVVVASCWQCCSGLQPAVGLLQGLLVASLALLGLLGPVGPVGRLLGHF